MKTRSLVAALCLWCVACRESPSPTKSPPAAVAEPPRRSISASDAGDEGEGFLGVWVAASEVELQLEVPAEVTEVLVQDGQKVASGELLVRLALDETETELTLAREAVKQARATYRAARREARQKMHDAERLETLGDDGIVSASEREAGVAAAQVAREDRATRHSLLREAEARLARIEEQSRSSSLRSPMTGQVLRCSVRRGQKIAPGQSVCRIVGPKRRLRFAVPPDEARNLEEGSRVLVLDGTLHLEARVASVAAQVDGATGMLFVEADVVGERLPPVAVGETARVLLRDE